MIKRILRREKECLTPLPFTLSNAVHLVVTPTYDGSGQVVHPDILIFVNGFRGKNHILCVDPYPNGDPNKENPSILVSNRKDVFSQTLGNEHIPNPISGLPTPGWFHSDSDMIYWDDKFWLYWRAGHLKDYYRELILRKSNDLIHWDDKKVVMRYNSAGVHRYCSPAIIPEENFLSLFMCDPPNNALCLFETKNGESFVHKQLCSFKLPLHRHLWHIDAVKLSNKEYWALACDTEGDLWFAKSDNRIEWTVLNIVLQPRAGSWDSAKIYRATFAVYDGKIMVWYSACNEQNMWHCGYTESDIVGLDKSIRSSNVFGT